MNTHGVQNSLLFFFRVRYFDRQGQGTACPNPGTLALIAGGGAFRCPDSKYFFGFSSTDGDRGLYSFRKPIVNRLSSSFQEWRVIGV